MTDSVLLIRLAEVEKQNLALRELLIDAYDLIHGGFSNRTTRDEWMKQVDFVRREKILNPESLPLPEMCNCGPQECIHPSRLRDGYVCKVQAQTSGRNQ